MKAFNIWLTGDKNSNNLICKIGNAYGYAVGADGKYTNSGHRTDISTIDLGPGSIFMTSNADWWLASPSCAANNCAMRVHSQSALLWGTLYSFREGFCPIVPLDL